MTKVIICILKKIKYLIQIIYTFNICNQYISSIWYLWIINQIQVHGIPSVKGKLRMNGYNTDLGQSFGNNKRCWSSKEVFY
ncbi:hypothetical protein PIROE2DRAFT_11063 [Piromyces sp. E2]|nr:hypothetical protein PIROE2DRAFT_11063 [Piromyces sp. E2]|eukprot:OUM62629.1 hypothetical protein PIROE2DRAFT_11063 [Piromyces sp. E2]